MPGDDAGILGRELFEQRLVELVSNLKGTCGGGISEKVFMDLNSNNYAAIIYKSRSLKVSAVPGAYRRQAALL